MRAHLTDTNPFLETLESRVFLSGDSYEVDNTAAQAHAIAVDGAAQTHSIHVKTDVDWVKFTLTATTPVIIQTAGKTGDTRMWLYSSAIKSIASNNDISATNKFSKISTTLAAGTYYVKIDGNNAVISSYTVKIATAFPLAGTRTIKLYGDSSIANGVQVDSYSTTVTTSTSDGVNYKLALSGEKTLSMVRSGNQLSLKPQPQPMNKGRADNAYMISGGSCGAFVLMGQTDTNPNHSLNLSIRMGTWAGTQTVTGAQLAGKWKMDSIYNDNLRNGPASPFSTESFTVTVTDLGNGKIRVQAAAVPGHRPATDSVLKISGNTLVPTGPSDPSAHFSSIVTDGQHIAFALIGVESNDATDVSATIAIGSRV